jgi:DNA primase
MSQGILASYRLATGEIDTARIKQHVSITELASRLTTLKFAGAECVGLCPLHEERSPSFYVNEAKGVFHCHGCAAGGDVITLVQLAAGQSFVHACEWLLTSGLAPADVQRPPIVDARANRQLNMRRAKAEWRRTATIVSTVAEIYLANRGIHGHVPRSIGFGLVPRYWDDEGSEGPRHRAMVAACQDVDGRVVGIQRTFLDPQGRKTGRPPRMSLGQIRGGALRLGPVAPRIMLATATEDALSLARMHLGASVWAAFGDANLAHVSLPREVKEVVLCGDSDPQGRAAVADAAATFADRRIAVETLFPHAGAKDFNEEWVLLHA